MSDQPAIQTFYVVDRLRAGVDRYLSDWTPQGRPVMVREKKDAFVFDLQTALAHVARLLEMNVAAALVPAVDLSPQPPAQPQPESGGATPPQ